MMNTDLWIFDSRHDQRSMLEIYSLNIPVTLRLIGGIIRYDNAGGNGRVHILRQQSNALFPKDIFLRHNNVIFKKIIANQFYEDRGHLQRDRTCLINDQYLLASYQMDQEFHLFPYLQDHYQMGVQDYLQK